MLRCICPADMTNDLHKQNTHKKQQAPRTSELCLKAYVSCVMTRINIYQAPQAPPPQPDLSHGESFCDGGCRVNVATVGGTGVLAAGGKPQKARNR